MRRLLGFIVTLSLCAAAAQTPADTFVHQSFGAIDTLDPILAYDTASGQVIENVYETLYSYVGDSITEYEPRLATGYEVSDDNLTYTFTLREGVQFHSGNTMTCADVAYSIKRGLVVNSPDSGMWIVSEPLIGYYGNALEELAEDASDEDFAAYWEAIDAAVECLDDYTVQFNLVAVDPAFFSKLLFYGNAVVDSAWAIENDMWDGTQDTWRDWIGANMQDFHLHNNMSGTGAYQLVSWDGETALATRFDDYWGEAGSIRNVLIVNISEQSTRLLALQQGDADRIALGDRSALAQLRNAAGITIHEDPEWVNLAVSAAFMNQDITVEDNPDVGTGELGGGIPADFFSDLDMRLCVAYSFDPEQFIEQVYLGEGQIITMALPPSFLGYDPSVSTYSYDPERAEEHCRAAWGGAVWEQGFTFNITYNTGNTARQTIGEIIADNLQALNPNFNVGVRGIAWPDFLANRSAGRGTISLVGWVPDYADSDNYIHTFYHSSGYYGSQSSFSDEQIDEWVDEARATLDLEERERLYNLVGARGFELAPFVLYPVQNAYIVTRDNIQGIYFNPMLSGDFLWQDISKN